MQRQHAFQRRYGQNPGGQAASQDGPKVYGKAPISFKSQAPPDLLPVGRQAAPSRAPPQIMPTDLPSAGVVQMGRRAGQSREPSRGSAVSMGDGFPPASSSNAGAFIPANAFSGARVGYYFSAGAMGLGYYQDKPTGGTAAGGRRKLTVVTPRQAPAAPPAAAQLASPLAPPQGMSKAQYARERWAAAQQWDEEQANKPGKVVAPWGQDPAPGDFMPPLPGGRAPLSPAEKIKADRKFGNDSDDDWASPISKNAQNQRAFAGLPADRSKQGMLPTSPISPIGPNPALIQEGAAYIRCIEKAGDVPGYEYLRGNQGLGYYIKDQGTNVAPEARPAAGKPLAGPGGRAPPRRAGGGGGGEIIGGGIASRHKPTDLW